MTRVRWVKMGKQWKTICHVPDTMDADLPKGALVSKSSVLSTGIPPWWHCRAAGLHSKEISFQDRRFGNGRNGKNPSKSRIMFVEKTD